jgi:hypothetical protein
LIAYDALGETHAVQLASLATPQAVDTYEPGWQIVHVAHTARLVPPLQEMYPTGVSRSQYIFRIVLHGKHIASAVAEHACAW